MMKRSVKIDLGWRAWLLIVGFVLFFSILGFVSAYGFGGMYGYTGGASGTTCTYKNPATNACSCPVGYVSIKIAGEANIDGNSKTYDNRVYYCMNTSIDEGLYELDQLFGWEGSCPNLQVGVKCGGNCWPSGENPLTPSDNCPAGFSYHWVRYAEPFVYIADFNTANSFAVDNSMIYCKRNWNNGLSTKIFGGMFATRVLQNSCIYTNPITGACSCPTGFTQYNFKGSCKFDHTVSYCLKNTFYLTVSKAGGAASGSVTSTYPGTSCNTSCSSIQDNYDSTTSVILTAIPSPGYVFSGWSGVCTGTATTCTVIMNSAKMVTATFVPSGTLGTCNDNQTLFRLYQNTNSHVSNWNTTTYPISVCYNEIFGVDYTGLNPYECSSGNSNVLFWMVAPNNSHVSNFSSAAYTYPVCYGDLSCSVQSSVCAQPYVSIVRLYNYTNSHVSNLSDSNYPYYLCCKKADTIKTDLGWLDLNGQTINLSQKNDSVVLFFGNENIDKDVNYSIYKKNAGIWTWLWFVDEYDLQQKNSTNRGYVVWKATSDGEYYFNISTNGGLSWIKSDNISISNSINSSSPNTEILDLGGNNFSVNYNISFNQNSGDSDDLLRLNWNFGDGSSYSLENYSRFEKNYINSNIGNINYSYTNPGRYRVSLTVTEKTPRAATSSNSDYFDIFIFKDGISVIPIISNPVNGFSYDTDWIRFNASQTFVVNCSSTMAVYNFSTVDDLLKCRYIHEPGKNVTDSSYDLIFKWDFDDGVKLSKSLDGNYSNVVVFSYKYPEAKRYVAKLNVTYVQL